MITDFLPKRGTLKSIFFSFFKTGDKILYLGKAIFFLIAASMMPASVQAQFVMDASKADLRKINKDLAIDDLGVGEVARIGLPRWCTIDGKLYIDRDTRLYSGPEGKLGIFLQIRREPGSTISITVPAHDPLTPDMAAAKVLSFASACGSTLAREDLFPVSEINGKTSAKSLIDSK